MLRILSTGLLLAGALHAADAPRVFVLDAKVLQEHRTDARLAAAARSAAAKVMSSGPYSVMQKTRVPPSGDKHDYISQAPYWWPDPAKPDGLPYIRKDGRRNPETNGISDAGNMNRVASYSQTLALAWYFTGDEQYAARAALLLRTWFLDPATRMNPNLNFGQAIPGINDGRGVGIIESRGLASAVDAAGLLAGSKNWSDADQKRIEQWFADFLAWLVTSKNGRSEAREPNNHGTFYDFQVADFALFAHRDGLARTVLMESRARRIASQIEPDGRQPLETARTRGISYSVMNVNGLVLLATLGDHTGVDLWSYQSKDGRNIRRALDWILPYSAGEKTWPYQQIEPYNPGDLLPALLRAAAHYPDGDYLAAVKPADAARDVPTMLLWLAAGK
jgi:hypothetical protein